MSLGNWFKTAVVAGMFTGSHTAAEAAVPQQDTSPHKDTPEKISTTTEQKTADNSYQASPKEFSAEAKECDEYLNLVPIRKDGLGKLAFEDEAAVYEPRGNCIIYNYYVSDKNDNLSPEEQSLINYANSQNCSPDTRRHELFHHKIDNIISKTRNGDYILKQSDRVKVNMFAELCCNKQQKNYASIKQSIAEFQDRSSGHSKEDYYAHHYADNFGSALLAKSAEERIPEKIDKGFEIFHTTERTVNNETYQLRMYDKPEKEQRVFMLFSKDDENCAHPISDPEIIAQSQMALNTVCSYDGKPVKTAGGKTISAELKGTKDNFAILAIDNVNKEVNGYSFALAENDAEKAYREIAAQSGLSPEEYQAARNYLSSLDLSSQDMDNAKIKDIRDNYKNTSLEKLRLVTKANYETLNKQACRDFDQKTRPGLIKIPANSSFEEISKLAENHYKEISPDHNANTNLQAYRQNDKQR